MMEIVMAVKFKEGRHYHITHPNGFWSGHVKVLEISEEGEPRIVVTKYVNASDGVKRFFEGFGEYGCFISPLCWNPKEINMTLENK